MMLPRPSRPPRPFATSSVVASIRRPAENWPLKWRGGKRGVRENARLAAIGKSAPHEHALSKRKVAVGSAADSDLVVSDPTVSRRHAIISRRFSRYRVTDLKSTNGTFINDRRLS